MMEEENIASVHVKEEGRRERVEGVLTQRKVAQDRLVFASLHFCSIHEIEQTEVHAAGVHANRC